MEVNLFSDDVVIILGAGASVPFGLPTGLDLIDLVHKVLKNEIDQNEKLLNEAHSRRVSGGVTLKECMNLIPIYCAINDYVQHDDKRQLRFDNSLEELKVLETWINYQVSDSIDDLVRHNRDNAKLLKVAMVFEILKRTHKLENGIWIPNKFNERKIHQIDKEGNKKYYDENGKRKPEELRNWIHNLINLARSQFLDRWRNIEDWKVVKTNNKIKIITFNYDSILETVLEGSWSNVGSELPVWTEVFEIIHPHGKIDNLNAIISTELPKYLSENADKIFVIHDNDENARPEVKEGRLRAKEIMKNANRIYAMGFAFAKLNCTLIGLDNWQNNNVKSINYINFDKNSGMDIRVSKYEKDGTALNPTGYLHRISKDRIVNEYGQHLQITDALMGGFLGEMPS